MLREWGFSLTPDPTIGFPVTAGDAAVTGVDSLDEVLLVGPSDIVDQTNEGGTQMQEDGPGDSRMECELEEMISQGPQTRLGKRNKQHLGGRKSSSSGEEDNAPRTRRCSKSHRLSRRMA